MRRVLALAALALALAPSACGGTSADDAYAEQVREVYADLQRTDKAVGDALERVDRARGSAADRREAVGAALGVYARDMDGAAARLERIPTPSGARAGHAQMVAGLRASATSMRGAARRFARGQQRAGERALDALDTGAPARQLRAGVEALERAGYDIEP